MTNEKHTPFISVQDVATVSYTHLDVYKRQAKWSILEKRKRTGIQNKKERSSSPFLVLYYHKMGIFSRLAMLHDASYNGGTTKKEECSGWIKRLSLIHI